MNKPAPLLTQAPEGIPSLESDVRDYLRDRYQKKGRIYLGVPHRLDRAVSGVVLFAKQSKSARRLAEQFQNHQVHKVYHALVEGKLPTESGVWEHWILKTEGNAKVEAVDEETDGAKIARTRYQVLEFREDCTYLELKPETGRTHQLRIQTAVAGCPILGDQLYGSTQIYGQPVEEERERIIALHGYQLTFLHPISYESLTLTAPLTWDN